MDVPSRLAPPALKVMFGDTLLHHIFFKAYASRESIRAGGPNRYVRQVL